MVDTSDIEKDIQSTYNAATTKIKLQQQKTKLKKAHISSKAESEHSESSLSKVSETKEDIVKKFSIARENLDKLEDQTDQELNDQVKLTKDFQIVILTLKNC
jgi:hypothetical protein